MNTHLRTCLSGLLLLFFAFALSACDSGGSDPVETPFQSVADIIEDVGVFTTLEQALAATDLLGALDEGQGEFTVFVPDDAAFAAFDAATGALDSLTSNQTLLTSVLQYHVVPGRFAAADLSDGQTLTTLEGGTLEVSVVDGDVFIDGVPVQTTDTPATNGIIHRISGVLTGAVSTVDLVSISPQFSALVEALAGTGASDDPGDDDLITTLSGDGPFTVLAPTDDAFGTIDADVLLDDENRALLERVLTYHVLSGVTYSFELPEQATTVEGGTVEFSDGAVNGVDIVTTNLRTSNGVVHAISGVLLESTNAVERAILTPSLSTLEAAVVAAGLDDDLAAAGPFTVFAPSDDAFAEIDTDDLVANEDLLAKVLQDHVVAGELKAADLTDGQTLTTLGGTMLTVSIVDGAVLIAGVPVATANVDVTNGVIHVLDGVILQNTNAVERAILTPSLSTLEAAVVAAGLDDDLAAAGPFTVFAPSDDAFASIDTSDALADTDLLAQLLQYHVVAGELKAADLTDGQMLTTLSGDQLTVGVEDGAVTIDGVAVAAADIEVTNGVVHVVGDVLTGTLDVVELATITPGLDALVDAVTTAGLASALANAEAVTVFAPDDASFDALGDLPSSDSLEAILQYHVTTGLTPAADIDDDTELATLLDGASLTFAVTADGAVLINPTRDDDDVVTGSEAAVITANRMASNGIIHVIDHVLVPDLGDGDGAN